MSTSLARRTRRIGLLPQLSVEEVMDQNMATKLATARKKAANGEPDAVKNLADLEADIARQLAPRRIQRLDLTPEEIAKQAEVLRTEAKAKRINARRKALGKSAVRADQVKAAFAPKAV